MQGFFIAVGSAVVAGIILWLLGVGRGVKVSVSGGGEQKKTGKKMVLVAWLMIVGGILLCGQNTLPQGGFDVSKVGTVYGFGLLEIGAILLAVGSVIAWFQKH